MPRVKITKMSMQNKGAEAFQWFCQHSAAQKIQRVWRKHKSNIQTIWQSIVFFNCVLTPSTSDIQEYVSNHHIKRVARLISCILSKYYGYKYEVTTELLYVLHFLQNTCTLVDYNTNMVKALARQADYAIRALLKAFRDSPSTPDLQAVDLASIQHFWTEYKIWEAIFDGYHKQLGQDILYFSLVQKKYELTFDNYILEYNKRVDFLTGTGCVHKFFDEDLNCEITKPWITIESSLKLKALQLSSAIKIIRDKVSKLEQLTFSARVLDHIKKECKKACDNFNEYYPITFDDEPFYHEIDTELAQYKICVYREFMDKIMK
jgi:hypothetical protein